MAVGAAGAPLRASGLATGVVGGLRPIKGSGMRATRKRRACPAQTRFARLNAALAFGLERGGRAALLAGASTIAFAAFGSAAAWAACSNGNQTISSATNGTIFGSWDGSTPGVGDITVDRGVSVAGAPLGVF